MLPRLPSWILEGSTSKRRGERARESKRGQKEKGQEEKRQKGKGKKGKGRRGPPIEISGYATVVIDHICHLKCGHLDRPHYKFCPSVRPPVRTGLLTR